MKTGLLTGGKRMLVMLSGGGDSVALLDLAVRARGTGSVRAVHVNYGLRDAAAGDERLCGEVCERLGVPLYVEHVELPAGGNMHDAARRARYAAAERVADLHDCDEIAVAHTADDQAETILYRLLSSPGRRAALGMPVRRDRIVRPLLEVRREELRAYLRERDLPWSEDESNSDPRFARARVRSLLGDVHPAATENLLRTAAELRDEDAALREVVSELIDRARADRGLSVEALRGMPRALAGLVLREFTEAEAGVAVPAARGRVEELFELAARGGSGELQVEGARLLVEYGVVRVDAGDDAAAEEAPAGTTLAIPGVVEFGGWRIEAIVGGGGDTARDGAVTFDRGALDGALTVRARRPGDRMRPRGLGGSKSLQDLFVDRKVPRRLRDAHPVVCSGDEILWVPGLAVAGTTPEGGGGETVVLSASD